MQPAQTITLYQPLLHAIAYNLVRCKEDAEDIVQETFLKWLSLEPQKKIEDIKAYLVKAVINNCHNHLKAFQKKKIELFNSVNMPDVMNRFKEINLSHIDFEINLSAALKAIQTKLQPLERAVYVLREVFDVDYETLQETLNKKKEHCRQLFCRAKDKLNKEGLSIHIELPDTSKLKEAFKRACNFGQIEELVQELKKDPSSK
ncbi:MAG TPA: sigma-70 family RNA polymerase sigma factor [Cyclobacteriaceae bacterium]|nr:sigma-70 family RNA polymerase sigma factor [Cyclobacteriaceae bacterium]